MKTEKKREKNIYMNQIENVVSHLAEERNRGMNGLIIIHRLLYGLWTMVLNCIQCCVQS